MENQGFTTPNENLSGSRTTARAAILICLTRSRDEEKALKAQLATEDVRAAAVDYGGEYIPSIMKIVERAVVAAKREGVISSAEYHEEGSVAGAAPRGADADGRESHRPQHRRQDRHRPLRQQRVGGGVFWHWPSPSQRDGGRRRPQGNIASHCVENLLRIFSTRWVTARA